MKSSVVHVPPILHLYTNDDDDDAEEKEEEEEIENEYDTFDNTLDDNDLP